MKRVSIVVVIIVFLVAATSFISAAEIKLAPGKAVVFQSGPTAIAEQFVVLTDQMRPTLRELQATYRGTKPEVSVLDYREGDRTTQGYVRKKPRTTKYPYFFLVTKDGWVIAQGELAATTQETVAFVQQFQTVPVKLEAAGGELAKTANDNIEFIENFQEKKQEPTKSNNDDVAAFTLIITKTGYYVLKQDASGVPSLTKVEHVLKLDDPTNPPPPPPIDPALSERAKLFQEAANSIGDQETGKKLAGLFLGLADQVKTGAIKDRAKLEQVMSTALDLFLNDPATKAKWEGVRKLINDQWTTLIQEGGTLAQHGQLLTDVSAGLDASAGGQEAISVATILKILTLILSKDTLDLKTILEILRLIGGEL